MQYLTSIIIGVFSGIAAALVTSYLSFEHTLWTQRRHDYGQLLRAFEDRKKSDVLQRLDLVALIAPQHISKKARDIKIQLLETQETLEDLSQDECLRLSGEMFDIMYEDISNGGFLKRIKRLINI